jgi:hypothetical protein
MRSWTPTISFWRQAHAYNIISPKTLARIIEQNTEKLMDFLLAAGRHKTWSYEVSVKEKKNVVF